MNGHIHVHKLFRMYTVISIYLARYFDHMPCRNIVNYSKFFWQSQVIGEPKVSGDNRMYIHPLSLSIVSWGGSTKGAVNTHNFHVFSCVSPLRNSIMGGRLLFGLG